MKVITDGIKMTGRVEVKIAGVSTVFPNMVVSAGRNFIASTLAGNTGSPMSHMAVGLGSGEVSPLELSLQDETARVALDNSISQDNIVIFTAVFPQGVGSGVLSEAGIFNSSGAGEMLCRTRFPSNVIKGSTEAVSITWSVTVG